MEKVVLMSIMTKYSKKIFNGTKHWEFRKNLPKLDDEDNLTVVVYSSKTDKAIVGEFTAGRILKCSFDELMRITGNENDLEALEWFKNYYKDKEECCAIEIINPIKYKNPINLGTIVLNSPNFKAPQNFIYINKNDTIDILIKNSKKVEINE